MSCMLHFGTLQFGNQLHKRYLWERESGQHIGPGSHLLLGLIQHCPLQTGHWRKQSPFLLQNSASPDNSAALFAPLPHILHRFVFHFNIYFECHHCYCTTFSISNIKYIFSCIDNGLIFYEFIGVWSFKKKIRTVNFDQQSTSFKGGRSRSNSSLQWGFKCTLENKTILRLCRKSRETGLLGEHIFHWRNWSVQAASVEAQRLLKCCAMTTQQVYFFVAWKC